MTDAFSDRSRETGVPEADGNQPAGQSRALVPLTLSVRPDTDRGATFRPDARFVAHLIATATHAPQTRPLRRAALDDVVSTYSGASARKHLPVAANGSVLSQVA